MARFLQGFEETREIKDRELEIVAKIILKSFLDERDTTYWQEHKEELQQRYEKLLNRIKHNFKSVMIK